MSDEHTRLVPTSAGPVACHLRAAGPAIVLLHASPGAALLTWGRGDPVLPLLADGRRAARLLPDARPARFWSGHEPQAEAPSAWLAEVQSFLAALAAGGAA